MPETQIQVKLNPDVNPSGSDLAVVNAARRSFNTRSDWDWTPPEGLPVGASYRPKLKEKDKRLIQFLARGMTADDFKKFKQEMFSDAWYVCEWEEERDVTKEAKAIVDALWQWRNTPTHDTPFNHCFISFEVKAPIFVARQLFKSEYLIASEFSRRYITDDIEFYTPDTWRKASENKKQGSSDEVLVLNGQQKCSYCQGEIVFLRKEDEKMKRFCTPSCQDKYYRKCTDKGWMITKVARLKQSAKKRNIPFDLSWEDLDSIGMPLKCKYLEVELDYYAETLKYNSPSVNRIDPSKGYTKDNVEIISNMANSMLLNATKEQLKTFIKNVSFEQFNSISDCIPIEEKLEKGSLEMYNKFIEGGLCPEQARAYLPLNLMTEWTWSGTLGAFAKMCQLRLHPEAQYESRLVARQVYDYLLQFYPVSAKALIEGADV